MNTFEDLKLLEPLQRALQEEQYHTPTPIQQQTIPAAMEGRDILGCAQTGTGKTAAFALPILNRLAQQNRKPQPNRPQALILAPTRELAVQIGDSFKTYGRHLRLRHALVYGGVGQANQVRSLDRGAHVLIATPGRLLDLMDQGYIHLDRLEVFVLDEADRMLDMGFLPDLKRIIRELPTRRQSLFFSATMPPKITELANSMLRKPVQVDVTPKVSSVERIEQQLMFVDRSNKQAILNELIHGGEVARAIVFTRTKRGANTVAERLCRSGATAVAIHGNKSQNARQRALDQFRNNEVQVLVATDVAARGIDIDGITHVINLDLPNEPESYVHRIGRTGRAGAEGIALSLCSPDERNELRDIERLIGIRIPVVSTPECSATSPAPSNERGARRSEGRDRQTAGRPTGGNRRRGPASTSQRRDGDQPSTGGRTRRRRDSERDSQQSVVARVPRTAQRSRNSSTTSRTASATASSAPANGTGRPAAPARSVRRNRRPPVRMGL